MERIHIRSGYVVPKDQCSNLGVSKMYLANKQIVSSS